MSVSEPQKETKKMPDSPTAGGTYCEDFRERFFPQEKRALAKEEATFKVRQENQPLPCLGLGLGA